jgi:hypothetical protein
VSARPAGPAGGGGAAGPAPALAALRRRLLGANLGLGPGEFETSLAILEAVCSGDLELAEVEALLDQEFRCDTRWSPGPGPARRGPAEAWGGGGAAAARDPLSSPAPPLRLWGLGRGWATGASARRRPESARGAAMDRLLSPTQRRPRTARRF